MLYVSRFAFYAAICRNATPMYNESYLYLKCFNLEKKLADVTVQRFLLSVAGFTGDAVHLASWLNL
jgi:hypothetical protein